MIIVDCVADLHGHFPTLQGGDLLIVAGDLTATDTPKEHLQFVEWLKSQPYKMKIFIGGNHDNAVEKYAVVGTSGDSCYYLCDSGTEFEGLKIWGSPWSLAFEGINPHCKAFTKDTDEELAEKWELIPEDIDILITHTPPYGILDQTIWKENVGSRSLGLKIANMKILPKLWVCGHIHESYGKIKPRKQPSIIINSSHVNERYKPVNKPIRIVLNPRLLKQGLEFRSTEAVHAPS